MLLEKLKMSDQSEEISIGDVITVDDNGNAKKVSTLDDTFKIVGICSEIENSGNEKNILVSIAGISKANTHDEYLEPGDLLVAEVDGTVKCKTAFEDDIDIIGMALSKTENNQVLMKHR